MYRYGTVLCTFSCSYTCSCTIVNVQCTNVDVDVHVNDDVCNHVTIPGGTCHVNENVHKHGHNNTHGRVYVRVHVHAYEHVHVQSLFQ